MHLMKWLIKVGAEDMMFAVEDGTSDAPKLLAPKINLVQLNFIIVLVLQNL